MDREGQQQQKGAPGGGKKKKKQAKKKKLEQTIQSSDPIDELEELESEMQKEEEVELAEMESKVTQSTSRNDDSEIDDDDVPSELLPVNWRNPALDVDTEIEDPPDIAAPILGETLDPLKESSQPEQLKETILENPEQYFEDPFRPTEDPSPADESQIPPEISSSVVDEIETPSPRRESLKYVSAWGHMAPVPNSDDESEQIGPSLDVGVTTTSGDEAVAISESLSQVTIPDVSFEQLVKDSLKGYPPPPSPAI
jgi:hypothetical protein